MPGYFLQIFRAGDDRFKLSDAVSLEQMQKMIRLETDRDRTDHICIGFGTDKQIETFSIITREWDEVGDCFGPWRAKEGDGERLGLQPHEIIEIPDGRILDMDAASEPKNDLSEQANKLMKKLLRDARKAK